MKKEKTEAHKEDRIAVSAAEIFTQNGPCFRVVPGEFIQTRLPYRGMKGKKFSSLIALVWLKKGIERLRKIHWIEFNGKENTMSLLAKVPKEADECLIGLRINCETPVKGEIELLIQNIETVRVQKKQRINRLRYFIAQSKSELFPDAFIRNKIRSKRKLFNHILVKFQSLCLKNSFVLGTPLLAFVDPSNFCNYKCPLCPTGRSDKLRKRGFMKFEDFKRIMDQIGKNLYKLNLYNWGEPFLNKDFVRMIRYAKQFDVIVEGSTNLSILDEELARELVASDLDYLIVAVDGITDESYSKYRVGGNLDNVLNHLNHLFELKSKLHSAKPHILLSFLPNRYNEQDIPKAIELFKEMDASFTVGKLRLDMGDEITKSKDAIAPFAEWLPQNPDLSVYDENLNKSLSDNCRWPWELITIHPDGNVSPCCAVYSDKYDFGNVLKSSFFKVWNGKKYRQARKIIKKKRINEDSCMPCNYCIQRGGFLDYQPGIHYSVL